MSKSNGLSSWYHAFLDKLLPPAETSEHSTATENTDLDPEEIEEEILKDVKGG